MSKGNDGGKEMGSKGAGRSEWSMEIPKPKLEMAGAKRTQTGRTSLERAASRRKRTSNSAHRRLKSDVCGWNCRESQQLELQRDEGESSETD